MAEITLEQRVAALERQNRRLRTWTGVLTALLCVPVFVAATGGQTADVIRANRFEVVHNGTVVAYLRGTATGGSLDVSDAAGRTVGYFDAMKGGGAKLCVYNAEGKCVNAIYSVDGGGMVEVLDRQSKVGATLSAGLIGGGNLTIFDSSGRRAAYLKAGPWGGSLDISKRGETVAYLDAVSAETDGGAMLCVGKTTSGCLNRIPR